MDKKKTIIAIILFVFLGLMVFSFANPADEETNNQLQNSENGNTTTTTTTTTSVSESNNNSSNRNNNVANNETTTDNNTNNNVDYTEVRNLVASLKEKVETATDLDMMALAKEYNNTNSIEVKVGEITDETVLAELSKALEDIYKVLKDETKPTINIEDGALLNSVVTLSVTDDNEVTIKLNGNNVENNTEITDGTYELEVIDKAFNTTGIVKFTVDTVLPTATYETSNDDERTNEDVTVTITTSEEVVMPEGWTKVNETTYTKVYSENTTETVTFKDIVGNVGTIEVKIENIDKVLPTASIGGTTGSKYWKQTYTFNVVITEENLDSVYYIWNGSSNDKNMKNALDSENAIKVDLNTLTKNEDGTYTLAITTDFEGRKVFNIKLVDKAGNVNYQRKGWYQIDNTAPSMEWNGNTYEPGFDEIIYSDQRFKATAIDSLSGMSKIYTNGQVREKIDVNGEASYTFKLVDKAGNTAEYKVVVDKTAPSITGLDVDITNENEIVKISDKYLKSITINGEEQTFERTSFEKELTNEGTYTIVATDLAGNESTEQVTIDKTPITISGIDESTYTYDGIGVTPTTTDEDIKSVTLTKDETVVEDYELGTAIVNAGTYVLEVTDNAGNKTTIEFTIEKATPTIEVVEPSLVYNGEAQAYEIIVKGVNGEVIENPSMSVVYKNADTKEDLEGAPVNAGNYTIGIYVRPTENYTRADLWKNFTVEKATPTIEVVEPSLVYNGEAQAYEIIVKGINGEVIENPSMSVVYKNADTKEDLEGAPVNAGNYTIGIYVRPTENYTRADLWKNFTVEKATPTIEVVEPSLVYNGEAQAYEIIVKGVNGEVIENPSMSVVYKNADTKEDLEGAPVNAGNYTIGIYVRPTENYTRADKWFNFTVAKADLEIVLIEPESLVYDGTAKEYKVEESPISEYVTLTYYEMKNLNNEGLVADEMYKLSGAPTEINVHGYRVVAEFAGNENYEASTAIVDFEITKQVYETEIVTSNPECTYSEEDGYVCTYDGKPKVFTVKVTLGDKDVTNEVSNDVFYTTLDNTPLWGQEPVEVGTYYVRYFPEGYEVSETSKSKVKLTIVENTENTEPVYETKIVTSNPECTYSEEDGYVCTYDGKPKVFTVKVFLGNEDVTDKVSNTIMYTTSENNPMFTAPVEVGTYYVRYWPEGYEASENSKASVKLTIVKNNVKTIELVAPESLVYDGTAKEYTVKDTDIANDVKLTYYEINGETETELTSAPINAGDYKVVATLESDEYTAEDVIVNFTIEKARITMTINYPSNIYDGTEKKLTFTFKDSNGNEVTGYKATYSVLSAGEQFTYVDLKDVGSYVIYIDVEPSSNDNVDVVYTGFTTFEIIQGETEETNEFTYEESEDTVTITGYTGNATTITLPLEINGKKVTRLSDDAFANSSIKVLVIPSIPSGQRLTFNFSTFNNSSLEYIDYKGSKADITINDKNSSSAINVLDKSIASIGSPLYTFALGDATAYIKCTDGSIIHVNQTDGFVDKA